MCVIYSLYTQWIYMWGGGESWICWIGHWRSDRLPGEKRLAEQAAGQNWTQAPAVGSKTRGSLLNRCSTGYFYCCKFVELKSGLPKLVCAFNTWHCISALCSSSLQSSSEAPSRSQREFISFSLSLSSHASSESGSDWRKSALLRLMDRTSALWASIPFCSSCMEERWLIIECWSNEPGIRERKLRKMYL